MEPTHGKWDRADWAYYLWSYYRMVEMVDAEIGRILEALRRTPYADNTVIVFTSDHGEGVAQHRLERKNYLYESAIKVPFIAIWPGHIKEDVTDSNHLVSGIDIAPTLCDYAGFDPPPGTVGRSLRQVLEGDGAQWRSSIVVQLGQGFAARALRSQRYKYVAYADDPVEQFFDLKADPGEMHNLAANPEYTGTLKEHRQMLYEWESQLNPSPDVPYADYWRRKDGQA